MSTPNLKTKDQSLVIIQFKLILVFSHRLFNESNMLYLLYWKHMFYRNSCLTRTQKNIVSVFTTWVHIIGCLCPFPSLKKQNRTEIKPSALWDLASNHNKDNQNSCNDNPPKLPMPYSTLRFNIPFWMERAKK